MAHLTINYKSSALNMPIMLDVLIPQGRGNYKVLYLLHGAGGDHSSWVLNTRIADYVNTTDIAVVMPSGNNRFYINNIPLFYVLFYYSCPALTNRLSCIITLSPTSIPLS
jgi:putative tributyrin esterase